MKNIILGCVLVTFWGTSSMSQTMDYDPDLWMPDTIPLALGNKIELYNNNIAFVRLNNRLIRFKWKHQVGSSDSLKWSWTANQTGSFKLTLNCFYHDILIDSTCTIIKVVDKINVGKKNILAIGNSLTASGFGYQFIQISSDLSFELHPIGTRESSVKHEGHGGWLFKSFLESGSPFHIDGSINFRKYIENNSLSNPDIVRISLGINDCFLNPSLNEIMNYAGKLIDIINHDCPNSLIFIALPTTCEGTGIGWTSAYHSLDNYERYQLRMRELWKRIYNKYGCGHYKKNIQVSYDGLCIDRINGYPNNNGVHPNKLGYEELVRGFSNALNDAMTAIGEPNSTATPFFEKSYPNQVDSPAIYPNPVTNTLWLSNLKNTIRIELLNVKGETLFRKENLNDSKLKIDTEI